MTKKHLSILATLLFFASAVYSHEPLSSKSHQIYFGPEITYISVDTHVKNVHIKGHKNFAGLRLGYEYLNPRSFYAGVDYLSMVSSAYFKASQEGQLVHSSNQDIIYGNFDLRFGYTLFPKDLFISPFLGLGIYALGSAPNNRGFQEGWAYLSTGLRSKFPINTTFSLGFNFKIFKSIFSYEEFKNHDINVSEYSYPWGVDIGMPMIWNLNPAGTWTFQIEPYWTRLDFSQQQNVFGSKFLIGVHF